MTVMEKKMCVWSEPGSFDSHKIFGGALLCVASTFDVYQALKKIKAIKRRLS